MSLSKRSMALTPMPSRPARVFIDSSVLIAGAISSSGAARRLLTAGLTGQVVLLFSDDVFEETARNLQKKFPAALPALAVFQAAFLDQTIQPRSSAVIRAAELVAAKDAPILAGAKALYLVTFDQQHLLSAADRILETFGITATTPSQILQLIGAS